MMDNNDELTIAARVKGWEIFSPEWAYLLQRTSLPLVSLCALSVGLHPAFADPSWVFNIAMPHFSGTDSDECCPFDDAEEGAKRAALLHDFIQRVNIAVDELAPRGSLTPIEGDGVAAILRIADFTAFATGKRWGNLPDELTSVAYAVAPEGLQIGGAKWPWGNYETELLQKLAAAADALWKNYDPAQKDTAPTNQQVSAWLQKQGVQKRTADAMATILRADGLPTGRRKS
jgi:hypothetical protein